MKLLIASIIFIFPLNIFAQKQSKDTLIDSVTYHFVKYYPNGNIKVASENGSDKKNAGKWIYFNKKGEELLSGAYNKNGEKDGQWWYKKREITYYVNGKIVKKGNGCKGCKF